MVVHLFDHSPNTVQLEKNRFPEIRTTALAVVLDGRGRGGGGGGGGGKRPASAQSAHPEVAEDELRAGVGQQRAVVAGKGQTQARLARPVGQLARQQLLRQVVVLPTIQPTTTTTTTGSYV